MTMIEREPKQRRRGRRPFCTAAEFRRLKAIKARERQRLLFDADQAEPDDDPPEPRADRPEPAPQADQPTDTRRAAARAIRERAGTLRAAVLDFLTERGDAGATDEEIRRGLDLRGDTARARRCELRDQRAIVDSGRRRPSETGRVMIVWVVAGEASGMCDHLDPARWRQENGKAFCPGCGKYMGNTR